jgi:centromere protein S
MGSDWYLLHPFFANDGMIDKRIENASKDLEAFAKHAGRTQISSEDVMLLTRRNEGLEAVLRSYLDKARREKGITAPARGRK